MVYVVNIVGYYAGADPEIFSTGGPTLSKKKPITHNLIILWIDSI